MEAKVILDSGSHRSFVTQDLKKEMALKAKSKKSMSIAAFGLTTEREEEYHLVRIGLQTEEGSITLRFLALPLSVVPASIDISKCYYEHLSNLDFAVPDE
uniref:Peptidase aspartic putative domain-containing protein n=1 Tax=Amphimedon queenslandica TaxID=400682 RepID=A0A1X7VDG4_AMPQE